MDKANANQVRSAVSIPESRDKIGVTTGFILEVLALIFPSKVVSCVSVAESRGA